MDWIANNKEWLFNGLLVAVPIAIIGWLLAKRHREHIQRQRGGKGSSNIQVGGDLNIQDRPRDDK
jgi:hypothetical protein